MAKNVLGRGLSALVPNSYVDSEVRKVNAETGIKILPIHYLKPNTDQPRKYFSDNGLGELSASIKEKGILQPIIVSHYKEDLYNIICGERRWRAAQKAGLKEVPVVIKDLADQEFLEIALIENIQREDLNIIEEARAYARLQEENGYTHEEIAEKVSKDRATISNALRLLKLPGDILDLLITKKISAGHARALLSIPAEDQQRFMVRRIVDEGLSVRQVEKMIQQKVFKKRKPKEARKLDAEIVHLENLIQEKIGSKVRIFSGKKNKGRLEISYNSLDELDRILELLKVYEK